MIEGGSVVLRFLGDDKSMKAASARFFTSMVKIAKAAAVAGIAVAAVSAKMAADFDKGMREISTLITDVTDSDIKVMSNEIKRLGIESGQSLKSISKGLYDITSAGFTKASDGALVLAASTKLAVGGVTDVANAADIITTALNSYQLQAKDATLVSDILFTTVRLGKTTMTELGASLGQVLPFSNAADLSLRDVGAAMATITASGINTRIATTALKNAMFSLAAPMDSAKESMANAGTEIIKLDDGTMDLLATIKQFRGLSLDEIRKFIPEKRAATAILSMAQNFDKLKANLIEFQDVSGATETANEKMQKSFAVQFAKIKNIVQVTMITLGDEILPAILPAIQEIGDYLVSHAENIATFFKKIGEVVAAVFADFNSFVMAASGIVFAINSIKLAFIGLNLVANANWISILLIAVASGVPFLISMFKKLSNGVDINMTLIIEKLKEAGASAETLNKTLAAISLREARENVVSYVNSLDKLERQIIRRFTLSESYEKLNEIMTDGKIDVDKVTAALGPLNKKFIELVGIIPDKKRGFFADNTARNIIIGQLKVIGRLIDKYSSLITVTNDLAAAKKKLAGLSLTSEFEVSGINVNKITPTIERVVEEWNNILREDLFADYEMPKFETLELSIDANFALFNKDLAEARLKLNDYTASFETLQNKIKAEFVISGQFDKLQEIMIDGKVDAELFKKALSEMGDNTGFDELYNAFVLMLDDMKTAQEEFKDASGTIISAEEVEAETKEAKAAYERYLEDIKNLNEKSVADQKDLWDMLGSFIQSTASMMGSAFAQFSQDLLDDNISIKDSFKNLWDTIISNFITSIAAMIGQLLLLFAVYTALNLASGGGLGAVISGGEKSGKFFQGLSGALFGGGLSGENIMGAFAKDAVVGDAIITPQGQVIHTDPQDYIYAAKDPSVIPAMAGASGGGNVNVNINIRAMDGSDVYRTLTDNAGKVNQALNTIVGRHFK